MTKISLLLVIIFTGNFLFSQIYLQFNPIGDASIGFHDGGTSEDVNYGYASHFSAFSQPAVTVVGENAGWGLIQFDLTTIPVGSEIISADLNLIAFGDDFSSFINSGHQGSNACWLSRITENWDEYLVTWNTQPNITAVGQINVPESTNPYENYVIDIKEIVQDMVDNPASNFGLALHLQNESPTQGLMFKSKDALDEDEWPELTVNFTEPTDISSFDSDETIITISPNPTNQDAEILLNNISNNYYTIEVFNLNGHLIKILNTTAQNPHFLVSDMDAGIYYLKIRKENEENSRYIKLIVF